MAVTEIPMNLTRLENLTVPNINFSSNPNLIIQNIIIQSNEMTNGLIGFFSMFILSIVLFFSLADKSAIGDFGYSDARALSISLGISVLIGLTMISTGFIQNYLSIGTFTILYLLSLILIIIYENKE